MKNKNEKRICNSKQQLEQNGCRFYLLIFFSFDFFFWKFLTKIIILPNEISQESNWNENRETKQMENIPKMKLIADYEKNTKLLNIQINQIMDAKQKWFNSALSRTVIIHSFLFLNMQYVWYEQFWLSVVHTCCHHTNKSYS